MGEESKVFRENYFKYNIAINDAPSRFASVFSDNVNNTSLFK